MSMYIKAKGIVLYLEIKERHARGSTEVLLLY